MSLLEDVERHGDALLRLVGSGVPVAAACEALGIKRGRGYEILRARGRGSGRRTVITTGLREQVIAVFEESASINRAAKVVGVSHGAARRVLVGAGLVAAATAVRGKAQARVRFGELIEAGWSTARAAREVGVNRRTGLDWRNGVRKVANTRVYPSGLVVDSDTGTRYLTCMTRSTDAVTSDRISDRYLSLDERLAIADGLVNRLTLVAIAAGIGKHKATESREVRAHSIMPHQAHRDAAAARARPKAPKLVTDPVPIPAADGLPIARPAR